MTWIVLAAGTAVAYALHGAWSKRVSLRIGALPSAWALYAFAVPLLAAYLALRGIPPVTPRFWGIAGLNWGLNLAATGLFLSALRAGDLGVTYPLLALTPLFVLPIELLVLGETPTAAGGLGIALMVLGVYLLHFTERRAGVLAPIAALMRSPGARRSLAVAVLWSVTGTLDRAAVLESSPAFYGVALAGGLSLLLLPFAGRALRGPRDAGDAADGGGRGALLAVHGLLFALMFVLQMEALELALASYVLAVKRTGVILAVVLGWAAFSEQALGPRLVGASVTVLGVTILAVWG